MPEGRAVLLRVQGNKYGVDMGKTYFIDSENVGDNWISLLATVTAEDEIIVFYTKNSPHMNYGNLILLKESDARVSFIECFEGSNALDFQLCTELGRRIPDMGDNDYIVVSNDTGYDAIVKYWRRENVSVRRMTGRECVGKKKANGPKTKPAKETEKNTDSNSDSNTDRNIDKNVDKKADRNSDRNTDNNTDKNTDKTADAGFDEKQSITGTGGSDKTKGNKNNDNKNIDNKNNDNKIKDNKNKDNNNKDNKNKDNNSDIAGKQNTDIVDDRAKEILFLIGKDNLQDLHGALQLFYGNKKAKSLYNAVKSGTAYSNFLSHHVAMNVNEKQAAYCKLVFEADDPKLVMPADFPQFVTETWKKKKNLNSFRAALQSKYGKENIEKYYGLIKAHIKILDRIDPADREN